MFIMFLPHILFFCRVSTALIFASAFFGKATNIGAFEETVARFDLFPRRFARPAAWFLLGGELIVVILMLLGGVWVEWGLALGALLLLSFSLALASVLARNIQTSCNCFGASTKPVTSYDLWRNACFISCALGGYTAALNSRNAPFHPELWEMCLTILVAAIFVGVMSQLDEIVRIFR